MIFVLNTSKDFITPVLDSHSGKCPGGLPVAVMQVGDLTPDNERMAARTKGLDSNAANLVRCGMVNGDDISHHQNSENTIV